MRHDAEGGDGVKRLVLNVLTILSLLIMLATAAVWIRSYWVRDHLYWLRSPTPDRSTDTTLIWARGYVAVTHTVTIQTFTVTTSFPGAELRSPPVNRWQWESQTPTWGAEDGKAINAIGFGFGKVDGGFSAPTYGTHRYVWMPCWFIELLAMILPAVWLYRWRRRRRIRPGYCRTCGYDLRATPGRCPECGTTPKEVAA
jgi:hypothetical protein